jgi:hypothetical protein
MDEKKMVSEDFRGCEALFVTHLYVAAKAATHNDLKRANVAPQEHRQEWLSTGIANYALRRFSRFGTLFHRRMPFRN